MASSRQQTNLHEPASDVELFIIGKTGNGKSATGNNILGRQEFATNDGGASNTTEAKVAWAERSGMIIRVVDGPGLEDTRLTEAEEKKRTKMNIMKALDHCPYGFHALLLILKYGNSFTCEEQKTVETLKKMLGDTLIKNHCILIFTHGESFDLNNKGKSTTFWDWCKSQTGALKALIDECGNRCLLFYNLTKEKSDSSLNELLEILKVQTEKNRRFIPKLLGKPEQHDDLSLSNNHELWKPMFSRLMMLTRVTSATASEVAKLKEIDLVQEHCEQLEKLVTKCMGQKQSLETKNVLEILPRVVLTIKDKAEELARKLKDSEENLKERSSQLQEIQKELMVKLKRLQKNHDA